MNKISTIIFLSGVIWGSLFSALAQEPDQVIAFDSRQNIEAATDVFTIQLNGENRKQLTFHPAQDAFPDWSPDGTQIAFSSDRDGNFDIWIMDADGSNLINATNTDENEIFPRWSPDGEHILCVQVDGDMLDIDRDRDICLISLDDMSVERLTDETSYDFDGSWSLDGTHIIFVSVYDVAGPNEDRDIYSMSIDNPENRTRLTDSDVDRFSPFWISENEIMYISRSGIYKLNLVTLKENLVVDTIPPEPDFAINVENDTIHLVYAGTDFLKYGLWYVNVAIGETYKIPNTLALDSRPGWRPSDNESQNE